MSRPVMPTNVNNMSEYEQHVWASLNKHWAKRRQRRELPDWLKNAMTQTRDVTGGAVRKVADVIPDAVKKPVRAASDAVANVAVQPLINSAVALLGLINDWARDLNDPKSVEKLAKKRGLSIENFTELRDQDLKFCDQLLTRHTLKWRTIGAIEGGGMSLLAYIPVAGLPVAITADILAVQVLSNSIAARIAYSYGYDAKDPAEEQFIQRLVYRSFLAQATKVAPLRDVANARIALRNRVNWSNKLRTNHRLIAGLEKLLAQLGPTGAKVPVKHVAKVVPVVGILIGAGMNSAILGNVARDAKLYCQTRFLCDKYELPMPAALTGILGDDEEHAFV